MSIQRKIYEQNLKTEASIGPDHKYLGKDKKFGRSFYEKDGQLHVVKAGGTHATNLGSTSVKANAKMIKGLIKDHVELEEAIKVGDTVHLGHGTKGGTGVIGKVTKIQGSTVHIKNDNGDTFKGPLNRATLRESVELDEANAKEYRMDAPDNIKNAIEGGKAKILKTAPSYLGGKSVFAVIENPRAKGTQHDPVVMAIISDPSRGKIKLFRYFGSHPSPTGAMKFAKNNDLLESVENLDEGPAHQNPRITAFGGMKAAQNTPSMKKYYDKLAKEREERATKAGNKLPKPSDDLKGGKRPEKKLESVEHLDELKSSTIRSYVKKAQDDNQKRAMRQVDMYTTNPMPKSEFNKLRNRNRGVARAKAELDIRGVNYESVEHLDEVSPPGFEGTVKAMKKRHSDKIDNPWALAWWMKNKGYKSHKKADGTDKKEK